MVISNGAKHSIHNALMAVCGPGDEVVIPAPYWVSYSDLVKLTGATPVVITTTEVAEFKLTPAQFLAAITPRTKLLMINSPSNPTGVVYERSELAALAEVLLKTDVGVLSDEIYEQLTYGRARPTCFAALLPGLADRTITISGVSKTYAMTGWRIGWAIAPLPVAKFMGDLQSQETSNPCSVSQWAALEAVTGPQDSVAAMKAEFEQRRRLRIEANRRAARGNLPAARGRILRIHEYLGALRSDARRQKDHGLNVVLHGCTQRSSRGARDGFRVRRRGLCATLVCHGFADSRPWLRCTR